MAEMRRPRDFWKSALCAQFFCFLMYMLFGLVCYMHQGQYSSILPNIDFQNQTLILVTNVIGLVTTMVAAVLYGNIGVKVFYENVLREYFKAPLMLSIRGRWIWTATVCAYWAVAFIIGSAIPNITALVTLVGAACILQFTYTFPPALLLGYWMQRDAMKADNPWAPGMQPGSNRIDTWRDRSRWVRGFKNYWYLKSILVRLKHILACRDTYARQNRLTLNFFRSSFSTLRPGPTARSAFTLAWRPPFRRMRPDTAFPSRASRRTTPLCSC